ncbi:MAG: hypothetical protein NZ811_04685 [Gammaproteobacteria bacterium]|nr:hypothetical protein [Gammaproteobacteria bacterium]
MNTRQISDKLIQEIELATGSVLIELDKINNIYNFLNNVGLDDEDIDLVLRGKCVDVNNVNVPT